MTPPAIVTGGAGWLGRRLVRALTHGLADCPELTVDEGRRVRCLVRTDEDEAVVRGISDRVDPIRGDLTVPESLAPLLEGAEGSTVFHCAGIIHPPTERVFYAVNSRGTRALVDHAANAKVRRFVHVSSNSPIGCNPNPEHRFDESSPYDPYMGYGRSKMLAEKAVLDARDAGRLETVIIRPPWFYGPGQPPRQSEFFRMIKTGKVPLLGSGENRRSMAFVDNICQGLILCEQKAEAAGELFWIADARAYSMLEVVETIADVLATDFGMDVVRKQMRLPSLVSEVATFVDSTLQCLGLYHTKIHVLGEMNKNIACTVDKARTVLGYDPKVDLREGMKRSVQDLLDQGATV